MVKQNNDDDNEILIMMEQQNGYNSTEVVDTNTHNVQASEKVANPATVPAPQADDDDGSDTAPPHIVVLGLGLFFAVSMCASSGVSFSFLTTYLGVPPALSVSWRFAWAEIFLLLPCLWSLRQELRKEQREHHQQQQRAQDQRTTHTEATTLLSSSSSSTSATATSDAKQRNQHNVDEHHLINGKERLLPRLINALPLIMAAGAALSVYFVAWVYSLNMTSLTQSFLFVNMGPVMINGGSWLLFVLRILPKPPSFGATLGAAIGFSGAIIIFLGIGHHHHNNASGTKNPQPSLAGDMLALLGAAAFVVYVSIGRHLRWIPIWIYAFGFNMGAYWTSLFFSFALGENPSVSMVFGYLRWPYVWCAAYLGAGPGIGGHATLNYLVKFLSPLTVSTGMLAEPLVGSLMGYIAGIQGVPTVFTFFGGTLLLVGLYLITEADYRADAEAKTAKEQGTA